MAREPNIPASPDLDPRPTGPVRTCIGCRQRAAKRELVRIVAGTDAHGQPAVVPDPEGTAPGRGAHLHPTAECYGLAVRRKAFGRALRLAGQAGGASTAPLGEHIAERDHPQHTP